jgi:hypothetical protein
MRRQGSDKARHQRASVLLRGHRGRTGPLVPPSRMTAERRPEELVRHFRRKFVAGSLQQGKLGIP